MTQQPEHNFGDQLSDVARREIRGILGLRGWTQTDLAREMHRGKEWISSRMKGKTSISVDDLAEFARALRVTPVRLLTPSVDALCPEAESNRWPTP